MKHSQLRLNPGKTEACLSERRNTLKSWPKHCRHLSSKIYSPYSSELWLTPRKTWMIKFAAIPRNTFSHFQLTRKLHHFLVDGHVVPVIHAVVTSILNSCNRSGIRNLWIDPEGNCWLFPQCKVFLALAVWTQVPQQASAFSQYLFTALAIIFKGTEEMSE